MSRDNGVREVHGAGSDGGYASGNHITTTKICGDEEAIKEKKNKGMKRLMKRMFCSF